MEKVNLGKISVSPGRPVIAGVLVNGKANFIALGSFGELSVNPAVLYISINRRNFSGLGIKENGYYSVNIPSTDLVQKLDYVGVVSGRDVDKSVVFTTFWGAVDKAPLIKECPVNILCKVTGTIDLPNNEVFIGEVVETYINDDCVTNGKPDTRKIKPVFISGGRYCTVGETFGKYREIGKELIK